jgi:hypothetical protein
VPHLRAALFAAIRWEATPSPHRAPAVVLAVAPAFALAVAPAFALAVAPAVVPAFVLNLRNFETLKP